jgi:hypothetical protein
MKKLWLATSAGIFLLAGMNFAQTVRLVNYLDILSALKSGSKVRAVFHYKDCKLVIDGEAMENVPDAIGGMSMDTFEYFAPQSIGNDHGFIASSHSVLIRHPSHGFVLNYVKLHIYDEGEVKITAIYVSPRDFDVKMEESFHTIIGDGKNSGAAFFYVIN